MTQTQNCSKTSWKSQTGFVWSLIGSAVGFANILSFSSHLYRNGGGAFLIPYCLALLLIGIPFLILEGAIGHRLKLPLVGAYGSVYGAVGKTIGWLAVLACLTIGGFYVVLTGYSVAYTFFSLTNAIPQDTKGFFLHSFLQVTPTIGEFGKISLPILFSTLAVMVVAFFVLVRNVKDGIERVCSFFMPLLALIMTLFALVVTFLPGGMEGWVYYLRPDFTKLFDPILWRDVFGQLFFSLSLGIGIVVGYSRHTGEGIDIVRAMRYVALGDFAVSFISGAAIFGCLAHISHMQGVPFEAILTSDSTFEIGFVVFPHIFHFFGPILGQAVGVLFFFCLFIAGITGVFSIVESIAGNVEVEFKLTRITAVLITVIAVTIAALFFCMGNASHLIDALVPMVMGTNMLIGGLALVIVFQYSSRSFDLARAGRLNRFCLKVLAPALLAAILLGDLNHEFRAFTQEAWIRWSWFCLAMLMAVTLVYFSKRVAERALYKKSERAF